MMRVAFARLILLAFAWSCAHAAEKPLQVVTSFLPAYCFAANVAGDVAHVENLLPGSVSLHEYQLSPGDIRKLAAANVIIVNGLGIESFLDKAVANIGGDVSRKIVRLSDGLEGELIHHRGNDRLANPHIWLDPKLAMQSVSNIVRALAATDSAHAAVYEKNALAYIARLTALDSEIQESVRGVRSVPFITYHDAFPYFVRRYELKLAGVVEQVPEVAPSPKEMSQLLKTIREQHAKALFTEPLGSTRLAEQIARDAGLKLAELNPIESGQIEPRAYEEAMRRNAQTLKRSLSP
jgi:zinc transport system substrate-binding protein